MPSDFPSPRARVLLLGASNLAIGLPHALAAARFTIAKPVDVFAAIGRGRSLGAWSSVFGRALPGILECRLWELLAADRAHPFTGETFALITDIGNDILYNAAPSQIIKWTSEIICRLHALNARIILALPPIDRINRLNPSTFLLARTLLYPRRSIHFKTAIAHANQLFNELQVLADREHIPTIAPPLNWYGLDPIHIRRSARTHAWQHMLASWRNSTSDSPAHNHAYSPPKILQSVRIKTRMPTHWRFLRINFQNENPAAHPFAGDSTLRLF